MIFAKKIIHFYILKVTGYGQTDGTIDQKIGEPFMSI